MPQRLNTPAAEERLMTVGDRYGIWSDDQLGARMAIAQGNQRGEYFATSRSGTTWAPERQQAYYDVERAASIPVPDDDDNVMNLRRRIAP